LPLPVKQNVHAIEMLRGAMRVFPRKRPENTGIRSYGTRSPIQSLPSDKGSLANAKNALASLQPVAD